MPDAPLTCLDFWCQAGSSSERPGEEGIAHFLEHMVFKGSGRLAAGAFDLAIEALGGPGFLGDVGNHRGDEQHQRVNRVTARW